MKKVYLLITAIGFLLYSNTILAQCSVSIAVNPNTTQLDCNNTTITLSANATATGPVTYLWNTGATTKSIKVKNPGIYAVAIKDTGTCSSSASIYITQNIAQPTVNILAFPDTICSGSTSSLVGIGAGTYLWQPGSLTGNTVSVKPAVTTTYTVTGTAANGCTGTNTLKLVVNPMPGASISANATGCQYGDEPGVTFKGSKGNTPYTFTYNENGGPVQTVTTSKTDSSITIGVPTGQSGSYTYNLISVTDGNGCSQPQSGSVVVSILPAPAFTSSETGHVCSNALFTYTATSSVAGTNFKWTRATVPGISNGNASGSAAFISETLHNTTAQPVVVNYVFTLSTGKGCDNTDTVKVTVNPTPKINALSDTAFCNGYSVSGINFSSISPNASFIWSCNPTIGFGSTGSGSIPAFTATNTGTAPINATVKISITAGIDNCPGADTSFTITVYPGPALTSPKLASICNNELFTYTATSSASGTNFKWTRDAVPGISNGKASGSTASINETLRNTTPLPVVVNYIFTLFTGTGCDKTDTVKVTVNPTPKINPITDTVFCNGYFVSGINFSSTSPGASFTWSCIPTIGFGSAGSGNIPAFTATNTDTSLMNATVTVSMTASSDNCPAAAETVFKITVKPTPNLISPKTASVCNNSPFTYTAISSAKETDFKWVRDAVPGITNGKASGSTASINETLHNITALPVVVNYVFTLSPDTSAASCNKTDTLKVTVNPTPGINPVPDYTFCNGDFISGGIPFGSTSPDAFFTWASADSTIGFGKTGSGSILPFVATNTDTVPVATKVTVKITASGDKCPGPGTSFSVTVRPSPFLTSPKSASVCNNNLFKYTAASSAFKTKFKWERAAVAGIANAPAVDSTAGISETLNNTTSQPVVVNYVFTLYPDAGSESCSKTDTVKVTVNPTPVIDAIYDSVFCNTYNAGGFKFTSSAPDSSFTWTSSAAIGFGLSGTGSIPAFTTVNIDTVPIVATVKVSITASSDKCEGADSSFTVTVYPTPVFTSPKLATVCDSTPFIYTATSAAAGTRFTWKRDFVSGIANTAAGDTTAFINEILHNTTAQPVIVNYVFTMVTGFGCEKTSIVTVTVNPTPKINPINDTAFCNGDAVSGIDFSSTSPNSSFMWVCSPTVGFGANGSGSIPAFVAGNSDTVAVVATVKVSITASSDKCPGADSTFIITVKPSPFRPGFTSFSNYPDNEVLVLCDSSENINFNLNSPALFDSGVSYEWSSTPGSPKVLIKDRQHPNTVISFNSPGRDTIKLVVANSITGCSNSAFQLVQVADKNNGVDKLKIFKKQPGNLLIYPDNTITGYQWGYDSLVQALPDTAFSPPFSVQNQVYQFFTPDARFIVNDSLDENRFYYWVLLHNNGCDTRVYYNGPYDDKPDSVRRASRDGTIQLQVSPNPSKGVFQVGLKGNIYGNIDAKIYNGQGKLVFRKTFVKTVPSVIEKFNTYNLAGGVYFLVLNSSDLKQVSARFLISR